MSNADLALSVNLKHSLWTADPDEWADWGRIEAALAEGRTVAISTAPSKEIRYGNVSLRAEGSRFAAQVTFHCAWDELEVVADALGTTAEALEPVVPMNTLGAPGLTFEASVVADTLRALWPLIDAVEADLIDRETKAWLALETQFEAS